VGLVYIKTFGCKVNQADSQSLVAQLVAHGVAALPWEGAPGAPSEMPAAVLVNACCVTAEAERKALQFIRRVRREWPSAPVVLTGCAARTADAASRYSTAGARVLPWYGDAVEWLRAEAGAAVDSGKAAHVASPALQRTRAFVKVQDGCCSYCAYCIVPFVRAYASRPPEAVLEEVLRHVDAGHREVVLTGVNIGYYGTAPYCALPDAAVGFAHGVECSVKPQVRYAPLAGHASLSDLIDAVLARLPEGFRLRVSSIEPETVAPRFIEQLAHPRMCPHLHLPLQSGSDRVLAAMDRRYNVREYMTVVTQFRRACPAGALTTDVLVGFPGETDEDFAQTLAAVSSAGFERLHGFAFSPRPGTRATALPQLPRSVTVQRNRRLIAHGRAVADQRWPRFLGSTARVLLEEEGASAAAGTAWSGYGEAYQAVTVETPPAAASSLKAGRIVEARLTGYAKGVFRGALIAP
jgi:threonylcarbamoyladenosine tRNA methylthiotransferase MtaB